MDLSGYRLEKLMEDAEAVLYRGHGQGASILVLAPAAAQPKRDGLAPFEQELALADKLDPAWAIQPLGLGRHEGETVLVLSDPGGYVLESAERPLELRYCLTVAVGMAAALRQCHSLGLIHRDVKPTNVFIDADGTVKLMGFKFAMRLNLEIESLVAPDVAVGTLAYMPPEQTGRVRRVVDGRSDLYAFGVSLYQMLTGTLPFSASDDAEWFHCHVARLPPPLSERTAGIPPILESLVLKLLAKLGEDRYQTAASLEYDLRTCLRDWQANRAITPFPLASRDRIGRFVTPDKLYGRTAEKTAVLRVFQEITNRHLAGFALVSGSAGIGKSSFVRQLQVELASSGALTVLGKADQYGPGAPYAPISQAIKSLVDQLLHREDGELDRWRQALLEALKPNGQLLVNLVPGLALIIGEQPAVPQLPPHDEKRRFELVLRRLVNVFATSDHPLILFLDDMQWFDPATFDLLGALASDPEPSCLLVICAYRSEAADRVPALVATLKTIVATRAPLGRVSLEPLDLDDLALLIADNLQLAGAPCAALAQFLLDSTGGNPFFILQRLAGLVDDGLLIFEPTAAAWRWDAGRTDLTENPSMPDLLTARLNRLSEPTLNAMVLLACLGNNVRTVTINSLLEEAGDYSIDVLLEAEKEGLIVRADDTYSFTHDRIQEAVYARLPESQRALLHLKIGRALAGHSQDTEMEGTLFEIVSHYNRGIAAIDTAAERDRLANLNLAAGTRAKGTTAYEAAVAYLVTGCSLLEPDSWERQYRTSFDLHFHYADCGFFIGETARATELFALLSTRSASLHDLALVVGRQVLLYTHSGHIDRAIDVSLSCLAGFGILLPHHPTAEDIELEYRLLQEKLGTRPVEDLVDLPVMSDPFWRSVMALLEGLNAPAGVLDPNLRDLVNIRMAILSLQYGNTDESCHAYTNLGFILGARFGHFKTAVRFGRLGVEVVHSRGLVNHAARVYSTFAALVVPWVLPLRDAYSIARRATEVGAHRGELTWSAYGWWTRVASMLDCGRALADVQEDGETGLAIVEKTKFALAVELIAAPVRLARALRGLTLDLASFNDAEFDDTEHEIRLSRMSHLRSAEVRYWIRKLQLRYYAGHHQACIEILLKVEPRLDSYPSFELAEYRFFGALSRAAVLASASEESRLFQFDALRSDHGQLDAWAEECPPNFACRRDLVAAEIARIEDRDLDAQRLFQAAIDSAREQHFLHIEALANELAARFHAARGFAMIADAYLRRARACYLQWGADGKVSHLDRLHPSLVEQPVASRAVAVGSGQLELSAVLKMSRAISEEIMLDRLIERLVVIVVEYACAGRGLLLLPAEDGMQIVAQATATHDGVVVDQRRMSDLAGRLPESILRYVVRTGEAVVMNDVLRNPASADESYIGLTRPRSLLCLPLFKQSKLVGVLYLENELSTDVFTSDRISVLKLFAFQAAISIENANLYFDLERSRETARQTARELRLSEEELRQSFDGIPALAWSAWPDGRLDFANKQWHDYTGIQAANWREGWTEAFHPDDVQKAAGKWRHMVEDGASGEIEARIRRANGEFRTFLIRAAPVRDDAGTIVKWYGTNTDIDDLRRAESSLSEAQAALARVGRLTAMGELTVSIAHEVNQPLMAIVTNAATCVRWLEEGRLDIPEARQAAERIVRDGHRAGEIVATIRALARKSPASDDRDGSQ